MMKSEEYHPLSEFKVRSPEEMETRSTEFYNLVRTRRTVRDFSARPVPRSVIVDCLKAAGTAPSGANQQPWRFVVVADPEVKKEIREKAEIEEREFYERRAPSDWLEALSPFGTDWNKPFLEKAPYLIAIFAQSYSIDEGEEKTKHYYVQESVGIATGFLITALHYAGLATLTHTPSPMGFLNQILGRPAHERPYLLLVVGYPAADAQVPAITKKDLDDISAFV